MKLLFIVTLSISFVFFSPNISISPGSKNITWAAKSITWAESGTRRLHLLPDETNQIDSQPLSFEVKRFKANPIIHREMHGMIGEDNINGPSLIRVPDWIENPLGKYYLYFAHHSGRYIRMAYSDRLEGPWYIYKGGVLRVENTPYYNPDNPGEHVASPDVHVDQEEQRIRLYYHTQAPYPGQRSFVALSDDGLDFKPLPDQVGRFYFRVFEHNGWHYALAKYHNDGGIIYRSRNGLTDFEKGPHILPGVRHTAVWVKDDVLYVFYSRGGDKPEHLLVSHVTNLNDDWLDWEFSEPETFLKPEKDYEGVDQPISRSRFGSISEFVHELRDPCIFEDEDGGVYLLYSTAGEWAIAIAELIFN